MTRIVAPYGTWPSPITAELLTEDAVRLAQVGAFGNRVVWNEGRPAESGRNVLVASPAPEVAPVPASARTGDRHESAGLGEDLIPRDFSARTQVHEYGGRCWAAVGGAVVSSNWEDQRLWRFAAGESPEAVTPEPPASRALRYADPVPTIDGRFLVVVREHHTTQGVDNELVAVPLDGPGTQIVLATGRDFFSSPAISPDGRRLAWLCWDHPNMPFDDTELWVGDLSPAMALSGAERVAGGPGESVQQARWSPSGTLHWVSDRSGWWNLYAEGEPLCPMDAEFGEPGWVFGTSTFVFTADGRLVACWSGPGGSGIGTVQGGRATPFELPYTSFTSLASVGDEVACIAASPSTAPAVIAIGPSGAHRVVRANPDLGLDASYLSRPEHVRFPTAAGAHAWARVYPPASASHAGPADERPPLVVTSHGGPTGQASSALNLLAQFFTSRGFAVADVDYRGSTGYGREYRNLLRGNWGVVDVEDCVAVARWIAAAGGADPSRCVIRGGSASGLTTLAALAASDVFAAGASLYGVSDLVTMTAETHKFESHYLDTMIGPWPEAEALYKNRSPINHLDRFDRPLILFQGLDDVIVLPSQSETVYDALRSKGVPVAYLSFAGEQHGFRRAETIRTAAAAELTFYGRILGFEPEGGASLHIDNLDPPA